MSAFVCVECGGKVSYEDSDPIAYCGYCGLEYERKQVDGLEIVGWTRTFILSLGAMAGTLFTAGLIHAAKGGRPGAAPRGWGRTLALSLGAMGGTLGTAGIIHLVKGGQGQGGLGRR